MSLVGLAELQRINARLISEGKPPITLAVVEAFAKQANLKGKLTLKRLERARR